MRFLFRTLLLSFLLSASLRGAWGEESLVRFEASHDAMGTQFTIVAYGADARFLAQVANEAFEEIDSLDAQMSNYKPESELSRINRDAAHEAVLVEPRLFQLIADSIRGSEETGGAFDITVGPLMKAWGFFRGQGRVPTAQELSRVMKRVGYHHVQLDPEKRTIRFDVAGLELDLGGVAKGYAVDRAVDILRANGVTIALVSSGTSSIYALGAPPGERAWRVTLRDPFHADKAGDVAYLKNYSFSASGNYEKFFTLGGKLTRTSWIRARAGQWRTCSRPPCWRRALWIAICSRSSTSLAWKAPQGPRSPSATGCDFLSTCREEAGV